MLQSIYSNRLIHLWTDRDGLHGQLYHEVEDMIGETCTRISRLLMRREFADMYGGDFVFLATTLSVIIGSTQAKKVVLSTLVEPMLSHLHSGNATMPTKLALRLSNSLLLLGRYDIIRERCLPFVKGEDYDGDMMKGAEDHSFDALLLDSVNIYLQSWAFVNIPEFRAKLDVNTVVRTPGEITRQALEIAFSRWATLETPLRFRKDRMLNQSDNNRRKLYFMTHVLFMGNHYGTRPLDPRVFKPSDQVRLYNLFLAWFWQFVANRAVLENIEELCEICYCILFLNNSLGCKMEVPAALMVEVRNLLHMVQKLDTGRKKHAVYPKDTCYYDAYTDGHALIVVASLLAEYIRYSAHGTPASCGSSSPALDGLLRQDLSMNQNVNFHRLAEAGYVVLPATDVGSTSARRSEQLDPVVSRLLAWRTGSADSSNVLIRVPPQPEPNDLFEPRNANLNRAEFESIRLPEDFWTYLQKRLAHELGIPPKRILVLADETYLRLKEGPSAYTDPHADFFYFVRHTDIFSRIYQGRDIVRDGACQVCTTEVLDNAVLCAKCARGYLPVFTAWLSLGEYNTEEHALLEFIPNSHRFAGYDTAMCAAAPVDLPRVRLSENSWVFPTKNMKRYDMIVFNSKTIHRVKPLKRTKRTRREAVHLPRTSIDVRFIILP